MRYKKKRSKRMYGLTKKILKKHEEKILLHKLMLNTAQLGLNDR